MEYGRGDDSPIDFGPNRNPFCSKSNEKPPPRLYSFQFERKSKYIFLKLCTVSEKVPIDYLRNLGSKGITVREQRDYH